MLDMIGSNLEIGIDVSDGSSVYLTPEERTQGMAVFGTIGSGKSSAIEHWLRQDVIARESRAGGGHLLIDRPGSIVRSMLQWMAAGQTRVPYVQIDPSDKRWVTAFSPLRRQAGRPDDTIARQTVCDLLSTRGETSADHLPLLEDTAATLFHTLLESGLTLAEADRLLWPEDDDPIRSAAVSRLTNPRLITWWAEHERKSRTKRVVDSASTRRRLGALSASSVLRRIVGQDASLPLADAMDRGWIVHVSLAGGGRDTDVLASLLLSGVWSATQQRRDRSRGFTIYLDEFATLLSPALVEALAQTRKKRVGYVLAAQFPEQIKKRDGRLFDEMMGCTRTKVSFKLDAAGARSIARDLGVEPASIMSLKDRHAIVRSPKDPRPRHIRIPDLDTFAASRKRTIRWRDRRMDRWHDAFVFTPDEADARLCDRMEKLLDSEGRKTPAVSEPDNFARRLGGRHQ